MQSKLEKMLKDYDKARLTGIESGLRESGIFEFVETKKAYCAQYREGDEDYGVGGREGLWCAFDDSRGNRHSFGNLMNIKTLLGADLSAKEIGETVSMTVEPSPQFNIKRIKCASFMGMFICFGSGL